MRRFCEVLGSMVEFDFSIRFHSPFNVGDNIDMLVEEMEAQDTD